MGWWSTDIMGGDPPLDFQYEILEICRVDLDEDPDSVLTAQELEQHLPQILVDLRADGRSVGFQVLGVMMMRAKAPISPELKDEIIKRAKMDEWAREDAERAEVIQDFCTAVANY